jgi:hypothetical protein
MGSSLSKSHLHRNYWSEETGQVTSHASAPLQFLFGNGGAYIADKTRHNGRSLGLTPVTSAMPLFRGLHTGVLGQHGTGFRSLTSARRPM